MSLVARKAGVSPATVSRAEDGLPIQELKAIQIADALTELLRRKVSIEDIEGLKVYA
jgi:DNA-binding LacI/PurR family transcriptional regulator